MAKNIIDSFHQKIHDGQAFFHIDWSQISGAGTREILIETGKGQEIHFEGAMSSDGAAVITFFEDTEKVRVGANALTGFNRKRYSLHNSILRLSHTPSGSGDGTQLYKTSVGSTGVGQTSTGGDAASRYEFILKENTRYLIRVAGTDIDVAIFLNWYQIFEETATTTTTTTTTTTS